jgi:hypothetical protein
MKINYLLFTDAMRAWLLAARGQMNLRQVDVAKAVKLGKNFNTTQVLLSKLEQGGAKKVAEPNWKKLAGYYVKNGVKPFVELSSNEKPVDTSASAAPGIDPKQIAKELKALKTSSKSSWKSIGETLGLHSQTLGIFLRTGELGEKSLQKVRAGLDRLNALPQKLVDQGTLAAPKEMKGTKVPKATAKKARPSLIHPAPIMPTDVALALRELDAISIIKAHNALHPNFMNGKAGKLIQA